MSDNGADTGKPLTGRKVFAIFAGAFGLIIAVNLFMAYSAVGTFPGLEVKNSYVANQTFDEERRAQEALGWTVVAATEGSALSLDITGPDGKPARVESIEATVGRATQRTDDQTLAFAQNDAGTHVSAITPLAPGKWEVRLLATATNGVTFRQRLKIVIPEG